jgi:hypothetical protein
MQNTTINLPSISQLQIIWIALIGYNERDLPDELSPIF